MTDVSHIDCIDAAMKLTMICKIHCSLESDEHVYVITKMSVVCLSEW